MKAWVLLLTCLTTRAVYLEPVWGLTAEQFLHAYRRFVARRGRPARILSDNGTQFVLTAKTLKECCRPPNQVDWTFIPQLSPWQGGVYERLVALVKSAFKSTLGRTTLTKEELRTFTAEVEAAINSRPLTFVSSEPDAPLPLRPIDFLQPWAIVEDSPEFPVDMDDASTAGRLMSNWETTQALLDRFWNRWSKEYLLTLRERSGWKHRNHGTTPDQKPQVGDVVLVEEDRRPRNLWTIGRIIELLKSKDVTRNAKVKTSDGRLQSRPINKLYPLEVPIEAPYSKEPEPDLTPQKPSRKARKGQPSHSMVTRSKARDLLCTALMIIMFLMKCVSSCSISCNANGVSVHVDRNGTETIICCDELDCRTSKLDTYEDVEISSLHKYQCDLQCHHADDNSDPPPISIECRPQSSSSWLMLSVITATIVTTLSIAICLVVRWKRSRQQANRNVEETPALKLPKSSTQQDREQNVQQCPRSVLHLLMDDPNAHQAS